MLLRVRTDLVFEYPVGDLRAFSPDAVHADAPAYSSGLHDEFAIVPRRFAEAYVSARGYLGGRCWPEAMFGRQEDGLCNTDSCMCRLRCLFCEKPLAL